MEHEEKFTMSPPTQEEIEVDKTYALKKKRNRNKGVIVGGILLIIIRSLYKILTPSPDSASLAQLSDISREQLNDMSSKLNKINDEMLAAGKSIDKTDLVGSLPVFEKVTVFCSERQPLIDSIYGRIDRLLDTLSDPNNRSSEISYYQAVLSNLRSQTEQSSELHALVKALRKIKNAKIKTAIEKDSTVQEHFRRLQIIDAELDQSLIDSKDAKAHWKQ